MTKIHLYILNGVVTYFTDMHNYVCGAMRYLTRYLQVRELLVRPCRKYIYIERGQSSGSIQSLHNRDCACSLWHSTFEVKTSMMVCRNHDAGPPVAARAQRGRALLQADRAAEAARSRGGLQAARYLQRLHRMLRLEECAMEADICR